MFGLDTWIAHFSDGATLVLVVVVAVVLGLRHATDPDHLAAVTTLVAAGRDRAARTAARLVGLLPAISALVIVIAGAAMTVRALPKVS